MFVYLRAIAALLAFSIVYGFSVGSVAAAEEPSPPEYEITSEELWLPMPDGVRLAADVYFPTGGEPGERFPVLWEYYPYRKDENRGNRYSLYSYFVQRGYVLVRFDIRGTGTSEGDLVEYEYSDQEQEDAEVIIDWLSKQPWSNGKVGMFGISWGAFNSIQMAMRNPPALKAILAHQGTDDIYQDDVHFIDGMMHVDSYEIGLDVMNILPAPPGYEINDKYFRERFDTKPWMLLYKQQQRDGPFWDRASLNTDYSKIKIPTYVMGGWYDAYRDSVPRMLEHVKAPIKGLMGPWAHAYPHNAYPKPQIEWRREAVRWFDYWLKGRDTGVMDEPRFAVFVRDWHPPGPQQEVPGAWRWEEGWPIERVEHRVLYPQPDRSLTAAKPGKDIQRLRYVPTVGIEAAGTVMWWGDFAWDQGPVDAYSLVYDTPPLSEDLELLGMPRAILNVSADAPQANWFVRISDVAPDGSVTQVAGAGFNGSHRESAARPKALTPGKVYSLEIDLHVTSWVFPKGHRIRLAVNNALWPMIWPTPYLMTTSLHLGGENPTRVVLPVVPYENRPRPNFHPPVEDPTLAEYRGSSLASDTDSGYAEVSTVERDVRNQTTTVVATSGGGAKYPWGTRRSTERITHKARDDRPDLTTVDGEFTTTMELEDRVLSFEGILSFRSDRENFYYTYTRRLLKDGELVREKIWDETIPRDHQ